MSLIKLKNTRTLFLILIVCANYPAYSASTFLTTFGINHLNPSDMSSTGKYQFIIGGDQLNTRINPLDFTIGGVPGSALSSVANTMPYAHVAYRLNPKWVVGFDYTHPLWSEVNYGNNSFVNSESVVTRLHSFDLSPRISYQVNPDISFGLGFDAMNISSTELSNQVPNYGPLFTNIEDAGTWGYGWNAGTTINIGKNTVASLTVYSEIELDLKGQSNYGTLSRSDTSLVLYAPNALIFRLSQTITPNWGLQFLGAYVKQSVAKEYVFKNTVFGDLVLPAKNSNNYAVQLATTYSLNDKWTAIFGGALESNPQPTETNFVGLPVGTNLSAFIGPSFKINKVVTAQLLYVYAFEKSKYNYVSSGGVPVLGTNHTNLNVFDFQLSFSA